METVYFIFTQAATPWLSSVLPTFWVNIINLCSPAWTLSAKITQGQGKQPGDFFRSKGQKHRLFKSLNYILFPHFFVSKLLPKDILGRIMHF